ncbi:MAG: hypothetical protein PVJ02_02605 [Gemmatimonadota bacterium]
MSHDTGHPPLRDGSPPPAQPLGPRARLEEPSQQPGVWDRRENRNRLFMVLYVVSAVLVALDLLVHRHTEHPWEHVVEFYPLYGFVGIVILVLAAKGLRRLVMRPEDYYDAR